MFLSVPVYVSSTLHMGWRNWCCGPAVRYPHRGVCGPWRQLSMAEREVPGRWRRRSGGRESGTARGVFSEARRCLCATGTSTARTSANKTISTLCPMELGRYRIRRRHPRPPRSALCQGLAVRRTGHPRAQCHALRAPLHACPIRLPLACPPFVSVALAAMLAGVCHIRYIHPGGVTQVDHESTQLSRLETVAVASPKSVESPDITPMFSKPQAPAQPTQPTMAANVPHILFPSCERTCATIQNVLFLYLEVLYRFFGSPITFVLHESNW